MIGWLEFPDGSQVRHSAITRVFSRGELVEGSERFAWQVWADVVGVPLPLPLSATPFDTEADARAFIDAILPTITPIPTPAVSG